MKLVLYSKPGCHLCEGLQQKLAQIDDLAIELEVRDITTRDDWFTAYQYEIPVLYYVSADPNDPGTIQAQRLPRLSPRGSAAQLQKMLERMLQTSVRKPGQ